MAQHDLVMRDHKKVLAEIDQAISELKGVKTTIETSSEIGKMDLKIGGLDKTFLALSSLTPEIDETIKVFENTKEMIEEQVRIFERNNQDITF